jgi:hypothetical protein
MHPQDTIPLGFCQCGCGERTTVPTKTQASLGRVRGVPMRFIRGHGKRAVPHWIEDPQTHCWIWQMKSRVNGYGQVNIGNTTSTTAHRWVYEQLRGSIPKDRVLDHLCRVRLCVNPDHMEIVTIAENNRRGLNAHLTLEQVAAILALKGTATIREIAAQFGIDSSVISRIHNGLTWHDPSVPTRTGLRTDNG